MQSINLPQILHALMNSLGWQRKHKSEVASLHSFPKSVPSFSLLLFLLSLPSLAPCLCSLLNLINVVQPDLYLRA